MRAIAIVCALTATAAAQSGSGSGSAKIIQIPTDSAAPAVSASAAPTVAKLGGRFTLFVTATYGAGVEVNLREPVDLGTSFEVRRRVSADRALGDGRTVREWQLDVVPWDLGDVQVPPIAVTFTAGGHAGQVETNAVPLKIVGELGDVVDDPKAMRGLAPPATLVARDWFWIWATIGAAALAGAGIAYLAIRRARRRRRRRLVGDAIAVPVHLDMTSERALEKLRAIADSGALGRDGERKVAYAEMAEVVRDYLGARYGVRTRDATTRELVRALRARAAADDLELAGAWLAACDLVKYGGARPAASDALRTLDDARALIVATTAQPQREAA